MSVRRPRRIFRAGSIARRTRARHIGRLAPNHMAPSLAAGLLAATCIGVVLLLSSPAELFGRVPVLGGHVEADALDVQVIDGQTLRLGSTLVRLRDVAAPARGDACGERTDCGVAAVEALAEIVRGHTLACTLNGRDGRGFAQATCDAAGEDVATRLVDAGWARPEDSDATLVAALDRARAAGRGMWQTPP